MSSTDDDVIDTETSDADTEQDLESPLERRKPLNVAGPIFSRQQRKGQLSGSLFVYLFLAFIVFTLFASYIMKPEPEPGAASHDCTLRDGTVVKSKWKGNDHGDNSCNTCACEDGTLNCSKKLCETTKLTEPHLGFKDGFIASSGKTSPGMGAELPSHCPTKRNMKMDYHGLYHSTASILDFYKTEMECADIYVKLDVLGKTAEDRDVIGIQVGEAAPYAIWINCGFHAREWIAPATCLYIYDYLLNGPEDERKAILKDVVFYFTPLANPDGYEYSRTDDRDWRKTREVIPGSSCKGIDLDRNWPYKFDLGVDISKKPCEENYGGLKALSAPENQYIKEYVESKSNIGVFLDVHSYGLEMGAPYGWTQDEPEHWNSIKKAGEHARDAIYGVHQKRYKVGQAGKLIYKTSGIASDWAYDELGAICSFTVEVRGAIRDKWYFKLPENQIIPNGEEVMAGIISFSDDLRSELCHNFKK